MDEFERHSVIHSYELLEDRLLDFLRVVPPVETNLEVHSPQLAGVVLEASGLLDSVFREISPNPAFVGGKQIPADDLGMADYEALWSARFNLPNFRSYLLVSPPTVRCPFAEWGQGKRLSWWADYNKIKHNRIRNIRKATLDLAIEAMCALHQILARTPDFAEAVLRRRWLRSRVSSPGQAVAMLKGDPHWASFPFLVGTRLYPGGTKQGSGAAGNHRGF